MTDPTTFVPTADLCDDHGAQVHVLDAAWSDYGARRRVAGPAMTLVTDDDNTQVRALLEQPGEGRVLVVDNGASRRCAMVGGNLGLLAERNGWAGIVVNGMVRDSAELAAHQVVIKALGTCPRKSEKRGVGTPGATLVVAGVTISPGDTVVADEDGVVVVPA